MESRSTPAEELADVQNEINFYLTRITRLQELLKQEEEKLYSRLQREKILKILLGA